MGLPRLRALDATPMEEQGERIIVLRDPEGYTDLLMLLSPVEALVAFQLNGRLGAREIADQVVAQTGLKSFPVEFIELLVAKLDENYMLDSKRFAARKKQVLDDFRRAKVRPSLLAGRGYSAQPAKLTRELDAFFLADGAPGRRPEPDGSAPPSGLVAPHIDFQRGKAGYAWAYGEILRSGLADLYVILGVAHASPSTPIVLTEKDYDTPFGPARVDAELARAFADGVPFDLRLDELTHRSEHSIEMQAVLLKYAQKKLGGEFRILPLLCSSADLEGCDPGERTTAVLDRLEQLLRGYPGKVCLLASVDLAHIGPCFGDEKEVDEAFLAETKKRDHEGLERLLAQDAAGFLDSVMRDDNRRKVCGVSALHAFSRLHGKLFPNAAGELLHYGHAADPTGGEVTFASMSFR
ncbi:MAG: AmmeMemoRadiSam system protein B [Elusimicrobiota bacterium]